MESKVWLILSGVLLSTARASVLDRGPPTFLHNNTQIQPQQELKEVITFVTPSSQRRAYESGHGIPEPAVDQLRSEEAQIAHFLRNPQLKSLDYDRQIQAELREQEARQQHEAQAGQEQNNIHLARLENGELLHQQLRTELGGLGQQVQTQILGHSENGHLFEPAFRHVRPFHQFDSRTHAAGEDNSKGQWKPISPADHKINLSRLENEQIIIQGQLRSTNHVPQENNKFIEHVNNEKLFEPLQARDVDLYAQRNIEPGRLEASKLLQVQIHPEAPSQVNENNQYVVALGSSKLTNGLNGLNLKKNQYHFKDIESDHELSQQDLSLLAKNNFLPLENAQTLYNSETLNHFRAEKILTPPPTVQPDISNNKPNEEVQTYSLLHEQGQILQQAHDALKNLHQRLLQSQQDNKQEEKDLQREFNVNEKEDRQQNLKFNQQNSQDFQNNIENKYAYSYIYPPEQSQNNEQVQLFHPHPVTENNQGKFDYEIQTDPLLNKKFNLVPYDFSTEQKRVQVQNPIQGQNNDYIPSPFDNGQTESGNQKHNLPKELSRLQYAPQYSLAEFNARIKESEIRNFIERQKAVAKAEAIANSPPIVIHKEVSITRRRPLHITKHVTVPVPAPYFVSVPDPVHVNVPQPYPVPIEVINPVPVHVVRTEKEEVERRTPVEVEKRVEVPVIKNVFVNVERPYIIDRYGPVEIEKKIPVEIPVHKPEKVTILRHVWKY